MRTAVLVSLLSAAPLARVPQEADLSQLVGTTPYVDGVVMVRFAAPTGLELAHELLDPERFHLEEPLFEELDVFLYMIVDGSTVPQAIADLEQLPGVRWAQADHLVELRGTTPNDPSFGQQWCHQQAQDHDMDSPEAWDITTGSDEFVVAIVDGGGQHGHTDLVQNRWENSAEIGGSSGVDDDGNGYTDDRYGWNAYGNNGSIPSSSHGTHVGGIVGARGNNGKGVAGVNWNVDLMWVAASSGSTSVITKGYNYVHRQKSLWLSSGGSQGANVVSTNSSFGVDFANCNSGSYPVWNDLYDKLGSVGVLSCAATMNINANVDTQGDVPTGCGSDYIVAVTNTTSSDGKNSGAAFGASSIDLGAPGTSIRSTVSGNGYSNMTGTSMATPQVAGAVALVHAAASADLRALYDADPASGALQLKQLILDNVDQVGSLQGKTVTGGRLNLARAVEAASSFSTGPPPPPPTTAPTLASVTPASLPALVVDGPAQIVLAGENLDQVTTVRVNGAALSSGFPPQWAIGGPDKLTLQLPQQAVLGAVSLEVENSVGESASIAIQLQANDPPALDILNSDPSFMLSMVPGTLRVGGKPGSLHFVCVSPDNSPSLVPGIFSLDIGAGMSSLVGLVALSVDADGWEEFGFSAAGAPPGSRFFAQSVVHDPQLGFPLLSSNVQSLTILF